VGEKANRIESHIEQQRRECRDNLLELKQKVRRSVDWRVQCEERPMTMVGIAVGGGALLSILMGRRSRSRSDTPSSVDRPGHFNDAPIPRPDFESRTSRVYHDQNAAGTWDILKGALLGLAATKLQGLVEELLPGFQEEYKKAEAGNG
jgi:hypothetical protein